MSTAQAASTESPFRRRGMLDAVLMLVLIYAVYAKTPLGAIAETGVNIARGQQDRPSWLATFKGRETAVKMDDNVVADATMAQSTLPAAIVAAAEKHKVHPEALAALMMSGTCATDAADAACTMPSPPRVSAVLSSLSGKATITADEAAQALAAGQRQFENDAELAIEAMWIGSVPVTLAVEQARRSAHPDPIDVEAHAEFLSPSMRRGDLQAALAVIAVHRLRTMAWPTEKNWRIASPWGMRIHPIRHVESFHNGSDIATPTGTPLMAAAKGGVKRQSFDSISGNYVVLDHGLGLTTVYCHMDVANVAPGDRVKRKQTIGLSGASGRVTGPHVHYIIRVRDKSIDPETVGESPTKNKAGLHIELPEDKKPPEKLPGDPKDPKDPKAPKTPKPPKDPKTPATGVKPTKPSTTTDAGPDAAPETAPAKAAPEAAPPTPATAEPTPAAPAPEAASPEAAP